MKIKDNTGAVLVPEPSLTSGRLPFSTFLCEQSQGNDMNNNVNVFPSFAVMNRSGSGRGRTTVNRMGSSLWFISSDEVLSRLQRRAIRTYGVDEELQDEGRVPVLKQKKKEACNKFRRRLRRMSRLVLRTVHADLKEKNNDIQDKQK